MKKDLPTPYLGKPKRGEKIFTYSENQLLDQITKEIMHAWATDLQLMKDHYKEIIKLSKKSVEASDKIKDITTLDE